jgi:hypothetical protein
MTVYSHHMGKKSTRQVRIAPDIHQKLSAISDFDGSQTIGELIDPLIREEIERRYAALPSHVRQTVEDRAAAKAAARKSKQPAA